MSAQDACGRRSHLNMGPERSTPSQPNLNTHRHNKTPANVSTHKIPLLTRDQGIRMMIHLVKGLRPHDVFWFAQASTQPLRLTEDNLRV